MKVEGSIPFVRTDFNNKQREEIMKYPRELSLKRKLEFIEWAIKQYKKEDNLIISSICIILADDWATKVKIKSYIDKFIGYDTVTKMMFPELAKEIKCVLIKENVGNNSKVIFFSEEKYGEEAWCEQRVKLLERVKAQLV